MEAIASSDDRSLRIRQIVRRSYNRSADLYVRSTLRYDRFPGLKEEVQEFLQGSPEGLVLDIGCGSGRDGLLAMRLGRSVVFGDGAVEMLKRLPLTVSERKVVCCDVTSLPFADGVFAGVIASGVLLHLTQDACSKGIAEIFRVVQKGGHACLSMKMGNRQEWQRTGNVLGPRWFAYYSDKDFAQLCIAAGFPVDFVQKNGRDNWFTIHARRPG